MRKKKLSTKIISGFLAVVMVLLMVPVGMFTVSAEETANTKTIDIFQEYRANNWNAVESVQTYISIREGNNETPKNSFSSKIKKANTIAKGIGAGVNVLLNVANTINTDASWEENAKALGDMALNMALSYLGVQLPGQSESDIIIAEIDALREEMNNRFDSVDESLNKLSKKVDDNTADLASFMYSLYQYDNDMNLLNEFTQTNNPNGFSYYDHKVALDLRYKELNTVLNSEFSTSKEAEQAIKGAYDNLYMEAKKSEQLYKYLTGENHILTDQKTIQDALYEYSILSSYLYNTGYVAKYSKDENDNYKKYFEKAEEGKGIKDDNGVLKDIEIKCIEFAKDLYTTYIFSQYALTLCYNYQVNFCKENNKSLGSYYDVDGEIGEPNIQYQTILDTYMPNMISNQDRVKEEIARYIVKVLNLDRSYLYENGAMVENDIIYSLPYQEIFEEKSYETEEYFTSYNGDTIQGKTKHIRTNNKVSPGDTLYMNVLPNDLASLFASGDFTFTTSDDTIATVNKAGVVNVVGKTGDTFRISMLYNNTVVYYMDFEIINRLYSGGMGTESCPYLISTWEDIVTLSNNPEHYDVENIYFKLTNDIDAGGATFNGIPSFQGEFDGNDHCVHNFSITSSDLSNAAFFNIVSSGANIKNLTIGKNNEVSDAYSVTINVATVKYDEISLCVGGIAGTNNGTIYNCSVDDVYIYGQNSANQPNGYWLNVYTGGIVGRNTGGTIEGCNVVNSHIEAQSHTKYDKSPAKTVARVGGLSGSVAGKIDDCYVYNCTMHAYAYSRDENGDSGRAYIYFGALAGQAEDSAKISGCYIQNISMTSTRDGEGGETYHESTLFGSSSGAIINNCWFIYREHKYQLFKNAVSWETAKANCESIGGHLVTISNADENEIVSKVAEGNAVWLGANDVDTEGIFKWITGEAFSYTNWSSGEPNNSGGTEDHVHMRDGCALWNDNVSTSEYYYICEWDEINYNTPTTTEQTPTVYTYVNGVKEETQDTKEEERYIEGETNLKYILDGKTGYFDCSEGRIDTSKVTFDDQEITAIHLKSIPGTSMYQKVEVPIIIDLKEAKELYVYTKPSKDSYHIDSNLDLIGLNLVILYDNGTTGFLNEGEYETEYDFATINSESPVNFTANIDGKRLTTQKNLDDGSVKHAFTVSVIDHIWDDGKVTINATHTAKGEKTYTCADCGATKTEAIPPVISEHSFSIWTKYDQNQHYRTCACGEKEYQDHTWDDGTVSVEPSYTEYGTTTYSCAVCSATKLENNIPPYQIPETAPYIVVDSKNAVVGKTVTMNVCLQNNPGITSMKFNVQYDSTLLKLTNIKYNTAMGGQSVLPENINNINGYLVLYWTDGFSNFDEDGVFATLTFNVSEDAVIDTTTSIVVTYDAEDIYDAEESNVTYFCEDGVLAFINYIPGDINGDGVVNTKDTTRLMRYLANWDVEVNEATLDVNGDGVVNTKDTTRLMRYLAGWDVDIY